MFLLLDLGTLISSQINPDNSSEEQQTDDEMDANPSEQSLGDDSDDEEQIAGVTLDDINRDDLTPDMQSAFDSMVDQRGNMNAGFTQARQTAAQNLEDAENWRMILDDPILSKSLNDAIYRRDNNLPADGGVEPKGKEPEVLPDQEADPEGYFRGLMRQEMQNVLSEVIPGLQNEIGTVSQHVRGQQVNLEFTNLASKYPAAASLGLGKLNAIRNRYTQNNGASMPLEEAFHLAAMKDPSLLVQGNKSASGKTATQKPTGVEKPSGSKTGRDVLDFPEGIKSLRKQAKASEVDGKSVKDRLRESFDKMRGQGESV